MEAKATAKFVRMAPRKVRFVMDTIRGKYANDALAQLKFTPNHAAAEIAKVIQSAVANAENNHNMNPDILKVSECFVDVGPTLKRVQPRAQGRAYRILKRTSHITVIVEETPRPRVQMTDKKNPKRQPLRAAAPTPAAAPVAEEPLPTAQEVAEETTLEQTTPATTVAESAEPVNATTADEATFPPATDAPETTAPDERKAE